MTGLSDGRVYVEVYAAKSGLTAWVGSVLFSGRIELIWLLPVVDYRAVEVTSGRFQVLDEEAGRCAVVHGDKGESRTIPYTISEKPGLSYGICRCGVNGGMRSEANASASLPAD